MSTKQVSSALFDVDDGGVARLARRRGVSATVIELVQNAWDAADRRVEITLCRAKRSGLVDVSVRDDSPDGFIDLSDAYTLFSRSRRASVATKRGRFGLGEKLAISLCENASIVTTKGGVTFGMCGRREINECTEVGTIFRGKMSMTAEEFVDVERDLEKLISPMDIETTVNGRTLPKRTPAAEVDADLPTEIQDEDGNFRRRRRVTTVTVYDPRQDEIGTLYEMGIPVVETGDRFHVDIAQKVPLSLDRSGVTPKFLAEVRARVLEATVGSLTEKEASAHWARVGMSHPSIDDETVRVAAALRFGDGAVAHSPGYQESSARAVAAGLTVVHGGSMSADEWSAVRRAGIIKPASVAFPPTSVGGESRPARADELGHGYMKLREFVESIGQRLVGKRVTAEFVVSPDSNAVAWYRSGVIEFNVPKMKDAMPGGEFCGATVALVIHELAHDAEANHLSDRYHEAACSLGAKLAEICLIDPGFVKRSWKPG